MSTIAANALKSNHPFFVKITSGPNNVRIERVMLASRSFDGTLKDMTPEDSIVLTPVDGGDDIVAVRHAKNPALVLQTEEQVELSPATETEPAEMGTQTRPSSRRITFMEITPETEEQKKIADEIIRLSEEAAVAEERRRTLTAKMSGDRAPRSRTTGKNTVAEQAERAKNKVTTFAKRQATLRDDTRKNDEKLNDHLNALEALGVTATIADDGSVTFSDAPKAEADETAETTEA